MTTEDLLPQELMMKYMHQHFHVKYVDVILGYANIQSVIEAIVKKVTFLANANQSLHIFISGH